MRVIPTKYPSGSARQLIEILTGKQVPARGRSLSMGVVMVNVGTTYAIRQAIIEDEPLIRRVVTLTGSQFKKPGNAWVRLGSSVRWLLTQFSLIPEPRQRVIMGGSMMGFTLPHADVPVVKITNCLLAPSVSELPPRDDEVNCIRCAKCADVCPVKLLPQQLYWYSRAGDHENAEKYNLSDCIECGACAWVCPSNIPLVHYYRQEKAEIEHLREEAAQAERAKLRFEAKKQRLEEERLARETRASAPARPVVSGDSDPVAAAILRIKAQQNKAGTSADLQAEREARKEQARQHQAEKAQQAASGNNNPAVATNDDARKAAVAAALARAKARKAELVGNTSDSSAINAEQEPVASVDPEAARKAAVAAAIARAKAKKAQTEQPVVPVADVEQTTEAADPDAARKAAVAAAIARAKAKKAQTEQPVVPVADVKQATEAVDPDAARKAAVAAAIARAKAKKAQAEADSASNTETQG